MQQFLIIAAAHFLALLSPGPDFFVIARTSMSAGWRVASGACVGIAAANGAFILAAFGGMTAFRPDSTIFVAVQVAGCVYLLYLGYLFIKHAGSGALVAERVARNEPLQQATISWRKATGMGFASGILNPKNALFYASLAAMVANSNAGSKAIYGAWMFSIVLLWDVLIAFMMGNRTVLKHFSRALPLLERASGAVLILIAGIVIAVLVQRS